MSFSRTSKDIFFPDCINLSIQQYYSSRVIYISLIRNSESVQVYRSLILFRVQRLKLPAWCWLWTRRTVADHIEISLRLNCDRDQSQTDLRDTGAWYCVCNRCWYL